MLLLLASCKAAETSNTPAGDTSEETRTIAGYEFTKNSIANDTGSTVVNVYNWGEYMNRDLNDAFEYVTGITVNYKDYPSNEVLYSTLKSGGTNYDVIIPSDYMIALLIEEDMLEPLNFNNIPNFSDIDPQLKNPVYDPENSYSVPYMWGTVGIVYNTTMVSEEITSWGALFDPKYSGNILMFDNPRDCIGIALKYLGYSYNTTDESEIRAAQALLVEQKPHVQAYVMDQIFDKLEGGEAAIGPYYTGDAITMMESNGDLAFVIPEEGSNIFVDAFCIPKGAKNKSAAEMYINFMCSYNAGYANMEEICYSTPLLSVYNDLDAEIAEDGISYPDDELRAKCEVFLNLPRSVRELYDSLWSDLKIQ